MVNELLTGIGILGVLLGVFVSTLKGYSQPDQTKYSIRKLAGSLLLGFVTAFSALNITTWVGGLTVDLGAIGYLGVLISSITLGFAIDQAHTASKN